MHPPFGAGAFYSDLRRVGRYIKHMAGQANHRRHTLLRHNHAIADVDELQAALDALEAAIAAISLAAANVSYDNATSGLTADDVQAALDELTVLASAGGGGGFPPQLAWAGIR